MNKHALDSMPERRLKEQDIAEIIKLRGLGYRQAEIAEQLSVSQSAIQYQLTKVNARARRDGNDDTFVALLLGSGKGIGEVLNAGLLLTRLIGKK